MKECVTFFPVSQSVLWSMVAEPSLYPLDPTFVCLAEVPVEFLTLNGEHQCLLENQQVAPQLLGLPKARGEASNPVLFNHLDSLIPGLFVPLSFVGIPFSNGLFLCNKHINPF